GEFVAFGALTLAVMADGRMPGTGPMLLIRGLMVFLVELRTAWRSGQWSGMGKTAGWTIGLPVVLYLLSPCVGRKEASLWVSVLLALALLVPMGPRLYRLVYQRVAAASVLVLLIISVALHFAMTGLALAVLGAEGWRT